MKAVAVFGGAEGYMVQDYKMLSGARHKYCE